jgi:hypothetical protein
VSEYVNRQLGEATLAREMAMILHGEKPPCLYPLPGGRRCCECASCQGYGFTESELEWLAAEEEKRHRPSGWMIG